MGKLILVKVTGIYDSVETGEEDEGGNGIKAPWIEQRRDWFFEDRKGVFPERDEISLSWDREKWDYDTRFGIGLLWKDPTSQKRLYGTVTQLLDCMSMADHYIVLVKILDVNVDEFNVEWELVEKTDGRR